VKARLEKIAERIGRLARRPEQVRRFWAKVAGPWFRLIRWTPRLSTDKIAQLSSFLGSPKVDFEGRVGGRLLRAAIAELEANVALTERQVVVFGELQTANVSWLWRLFQLVYRAQQWLEDPDSRSKQMLFRAEGQHHGADPLAIYDSRGQPGSLMRCVEPLIEVARGEARFLGRRRRMLQAARRLLLEAAAAANIKPEAVQIRRAYLSAQITRIDRLQAAGLSPEIDLTMQLRQAADRGDLPGVHVAMTAISELAASAGDVGATELANRGLDQLWGDRDRCDPREGMDSMALSIQETFGSQIVGTVGKAYADAPAQLPELRRRWGEEYDEYFFTMAARYLTERPGWATLCAATSVDGCFDVGGVASPARAGEANRTIREVRFPTQNLQLSNAQAIEDIPNALIEDPRTVMPWFAAGRLLTRRYVLDAVKRDDIPKHKTEIRFYVLDGSASMLGVRARMRDAILLAELGTMTERMNDAYRRLSPVLYYRYFNLEASETRRIATREQALAAISEVVSTIRVGGTDIQAALLDSFAQIEAARSASAELAQAQIVLVTDGAAPVDESAISIARARCADLPIGVSIIALGEENSALRKLAANQHAHGEQIFYQFMDDYELHDVIEGRTAGLPIHLPREMLDQKISAELKAVVADMEQHTRRLDTEALEGATALPAAIAEVDLRPDQLDETTRARIEAANRDQQALQQRFLRWFPRVPERAPEPFASKLDEKNVERTGRVLAVVLEAMEMAAARSLDLQLDAIEIVERLLLDEHLLPWRYADTLKRYPGRLARVLTAIHAAAGVAKQEGLAGP
jgi:hypothetical protein